MLFFIVSSTPRVYNVRKDRVRNGERWELTKIILSDICSFHKNSFFLSRGIPNGILNGISEFVWMLSSPGNKRSICERVSSTMIAATTRFNCVGTAKHFWNNVFFCEFFKIVMAISTVTAFISLARTKLFEHSFL